MPADIVAFPARRAVPEPYRDRLRRALDNLDTARVTQRDAIAGWRKALSDLQVATRALETRLEKFNGQLDRLQSDVTGLRDEASRMERWASAAERQQGS